MKFNLPWAVLAQVNHRLIPRNRGRGLTLSGQYRHKKQAASMIAASQANGEPIEGPVSVVLRFYEPNRRRRDPSNLVKLIEDALDGIAYHDDSQIHRETWERAGVCKHDPRVEIEVTPITESA